VGKGLTCFLVLMALTAHVHGDLVDGDDTIEISNQDALDQDQDQDQWLAEDLLLETDELEFDIPPGKIERGWWQGMSASLQHDVTQASSKENINRSKLQLEYESSFSDGFYLLAKGSYRYFNQQDFLAKTHGEAYGKSRLRQFWLQYSTQHCAYTLGRQILVWGEVDGSFVVDVLTPFDLTEQLFTDYGDLREGEDMLMMDCFYGQHQSQLFYTPSANVHTFSHEQPHVETGQEWGGRFKYSLINLDVSLMLAHLYWNTPILNSIEFELQTQPYRLAALGVSKAVGRLLLKLDVAYKTNQIALINLQRSDTRSMAMGVEYTTRGNQNFNLGFWQQEAVGKVSALDVPLQLTLGWSRNLLHDDLSLSLLANVSQQPQYENITWLATYKLNDICTFSSALSLANVSKENAALAVPLANEAVSFTVKVEY